MKANLRETTPDGRAVEAFEAAVLRAIDAGELAGAVAVATNDAGPVYERAFGFRDLASGAPMTLDTVFMLASMTKTVTSVAAMQLVEEGKVGLDQPLGRSRSGACRSRRSGRV